MLRKYLSLLDCPALVHQGQVWGYSELLSSCYFPYHTRCGLSCTAYWWRIWALKSEIPAFTSQVHNLLGLWPWAQSQPSLSIRFHTGKQDINDSQLIGDFWKLNKLRCLQRCHLRACCIESTQWVLAAASLALFHLENAWDIFLRKAVWTTVCRARNTEILSQRHTSLFGRSWIVWRTPWGAEQGEFESESSTWCYRESERWNQFSKTVGIMHHKSAANSLCPSSYVESFILMKFKDWG